MVLKNLNSNFKEIIFCFTEKNHKAKKKIKNIKQNHQYWNQSTQLLLLEQPQHLLRYSLLVLI